MHSNFINYDSLKSYVRVHVHGYADANADARSRVDQHERHEVQCDVMFCFALCRKVWCGVPCRGIV